MKSNIGPKISKNKFLFNILKKLLAQLFNQKKILVQKSLEFYLANILKRIEYQIESLNLRVDIIFEKYNTFWRHFHNIAILVIETTVIVVCTKNMRLYTIKYSTQRGPYLNIYAASPSHPIT